MRREVLPPPVWRFYNSISERLLVGGDGHVDVNEFLLIADRLALSETQVALAPISVRERHEGTPVHGCSVVDQKSKCTLTLLAEAPQTEEDIFRSRTDAILATFTRECHLVDFDRNVTCLFHCFEQGKGTWLPIQRLGDRGRTAASQRFSANLNVFHKNSLGSQVTSRTCMPSEKVWRRLF